MAALRSVSIVPEASALVESLRGLGYSTETALADLIDNSISAKADRIDINAQWQDGAPVLAVLDDGEGLNETQLARALRFGGDGPAAVRELTDLGRFGMGLKTASLPDNVLPTFYYRDHFLEMLDAVERTYAHVLDSCHDAFIGQFRRLSHAGQCLFIRMANRRGHVFHHGTLTYAEIDCAAAIDELQRQGFARPASNADYGVLLAALGKDALLDLARHTHDPAVRSSWTKARLAGHLHASSSFEQLRSHVDLERYVVREHRCTLDFLLFLYFGKTYRDLKSFALRDLGIVGVERRRLVQRPLHRC